MISTTSLIVEEVFSSRYLNRDVKVAIRLPQNHHIDDDIIYAHDGDSVFFDEKSSFGNSLQLDELLSRLEKNGEISSKVVIAFSNNSLNEGIERLSEYSLFENKDILGEANFSKEAKSHYKNLVIPPKGQEHMLFLVEELIPYIEAKYNLQGERSILGSSMGGLSSLVTTLSYQNLFTKTYCLSNAFWYNLKALEIFVRKTKNISTTQLYLDVGTAEESLGLSNMPAIYIDVNNKIAKILRECGYNLTYKVIEGGCHSEVDWRNRLGDILTSTETKK